MKIVATIEARMGSSRLPGKVLLKAAGKKMLEHLVGRLRTVNSIQEVVLATTVNPQDDILEKVANRLNISCFRGSEGDVMSRVIGAAQSFGGDLIVEITGDCPLIDPQIVEMAIRTFLANRAVYVGNAHIRSYPDGMDVQIYPLEALKKSSALTTDPLDREHVTLHMRNHPELFPPLHLVAPPECHWPELGLTLDEPADYRLLKRILEHFDPHTAEFSCLDVIRFLRANPELTAINRTVIRKGDS